MEVAPGPSTSKEVSHPGVTTIRKCWRKRQEACEFAVLENSDACVSRLSYLKTG